MSAAASGSVSSCSDSDATDVGWLYCFENPSIPGVYKIGCTTRTPEVRLAEANSASSTWGYPTPYQIVLTRKVTRVKKMEYTVHSLLEELGMRVHPRREFFKVSRSIVEKVFTLVAPSEHGGVLEIVDDDSADVVNYKKSTCICCEWKERTHRYPYHLISKHLSQIEQLRSVDGHFVFIKIKGIECFVCLTCKKGTTYTTIGRIGRRWCDMHSNQVTCCEKHPAEFERVKSQWETIRGVTDVTD